MGNLKLEAARKAEQENLQRVYKAEQERDELNRKLQQVQQEKEKAQQDKDQAVKEKEEAMATLATMQGQHAQDLAQISKLEEQSQNISLTQTELASVKSILTSEKSKSEQLQHELDLLKATQESNQDNLKLQLDNAKLELQVYQIKNAQLQQQLDALQSLNESQTSSDTNDIASVIKTAPPPTAPVEDDKEETKTTTTLSSEEYDDVSKSKVTATTESTDDFAELKQALETNRDNQLIIDILDGKVIDDMSDIELQYIQVMGLNFDNLPTA